MKHLLDNEQLSGPHEVQAGLRPQRVARCVTDIGEAETVAVHLCQSWGGASTPIVPVSAGAPSQYLKDQLVVAEVDGFITEKEGSELTLPFLASRPPWDYPAALIVAHERREGSRAVEVVELSRDDPWRLSYLASLGQMPAQLSESLCSTASLTQLDINEIIPVERVQVVGGLEDLLSRLTNLEKITPRQFSTLYLASGTSPNTGYMGADRVLPNRWESATAAGPNIVVVMTDDSVDDFALLWNLRAQWGDDRPMPIGIPVEQLGPEVLRKLHEPGVTTFFGFEGGHLYLVSETVPIEVLHTLAQHAPGVEVATPGDLLRLGLAPSRQRSQVQIWTDGRARVTPMTEADRTVLSATARLPSLSLSIYVPDSPVPAVGPLRARYYANYQGGRAQVQVSSLRKTDTVEVVWPTTWTMLTASAFGLGLDVQESQPGIAAMSLIRAIGNTWDIRYLCDERLIALLYELAERSGMSWWKDRWNRVEERLKAEGKSEEEIESLAKQMGRDDPAIAPQNEGRQLAYARFQACFGNREATDRWIAWAIEHQLIVKGVELKCTECRVPFWIPVQQMAPPHTCSGCARAITHPFRPDAITFKYRIGEVLRRCLELDALGHVLALRWLIELFDQYGLVGAHPGVEFRRAGNVVAEADVLLLFADGTMVPAEVKRRARGFDASAAAQLDVLSKELGADFDVMCVLEGEDSCAEVREYKRLLPDPPRFLLTLDQLASQHVAWSAGANPFETGPGSQLTPEQRRAAWVSDVAAIDTNPEDWVEITVDYWRRKRDQDDAVTQ